MLCCACLSHLDITGRDGTGRDGLDRPRGQIVIYNAKGLFCFSSFFGLIMYRDHLSLPLDGGGGTLDELFTTFLLFETTKRELMMADDGSLSLSFPSRVWVIRTKTEREENRFLLLLFFPFFFGRPSLGPPPGWRHAVYHQQKAAAGPPLLLLLLLFERSGAHGLCECAHLGLLILLLLHLLHRKREKNLLPCVKFTSTTDWSFRSRSSHQMIREGWITTPGLWFCQQ